MKCEGLECFMHSFRACSKGRAKEKRRLKRVLRFLNGEVAITCNLGAGQQYKGTFGEIPLYVQQCIFTNKFRTLRLPDASVWFHC